MRAIAGDGFAVTAIACCGDEWVADSLNEAGIAWDSTTVNTEKWEADNTQVLFVLREPVSWYRSYILDSTKGLGEFHDIDEEINHVFEQLGSEPEMALNIAAANMCAHHPGWLSQLYKMMELSLTPIRDRVAFMDYADLSSGLFPFFVRADVNGAEGLAITPPIEPDEGGPLLFHKTISDIKREERQAYDEFRGMVNW